MSRDADTHLTVLSNKLELTRRETLKLLAGGIAAMQTACLEPPGDPVRPYARRPAELVPGRPRHFATAMIVDGFATGLVVTSHEGRPTKVEGNPAHPASLGATSALHQASVLDLYDPCRARSVTHAGIPSSWTALRERFTNLPRPLWLVLPPSSDPVVQAQVATLLARDPEARVVTCGGSRNAHAGATLAFGAPLDTQLDFTGADVVLALDADPFAHGPMAVRWARDFARGRRARGDAHRAYVVEPMPTPSGTLADHRLALRASDVPGFALALVDALRSRGRAVPPFEGDGPRRASSAHERDFVSAVADDLTSRQGRGIVIVGERQTPECHAIGHALNAALGNLGHTVRLTDPVIASYGRRDATLAQLAASLREGEVGTVVIADCNPVHVAPPALALATRLREAKLSLHVGLHRDETSAACAWHAPLSHYLESWGAARSPDGTLTLVQPLIRPLHDSRTVAELLALLAGVPAPRGYGLLRDHLRGADEAPRAFESRWNDALSQGFVRDRAPASRTASIIERADWPSRARALSALPRDASYVELALSDSATLVDERFANNAWLQELPHPRTKQTWGNAALLGPALADRLGVRDGSVVRITRGSQTITVPAIVVAEHAPDSVTLELGYGRTGEDERIARAVGTSGYPLTREEGERIFPVTVTRTDQTEPLARTQRELAQHERSLAPALTRATLRAHPDRLAPLRKHHASTLPDAPTHAPQWAMTIDTGACSGCGACVIACQSENNVPVVGKDEVRRGREMHWLRIDTYLAPLEGGAEAVVNQPMMCQHCEHAPCEYVCPVYATEHSPDGLNEMTYQRCIGTRFCQANCPYKVRRFNWFHYTHEEEGRVPQRNPQVTVRDRGVMEKCTYCVQRIRDAEYHARMEHRAIREGEVITACQQACPTEAIHFGALSQRDAPMVRAREADHAYAVLNELGTRPRTWYLAKLVNANPGLEPSS